MILMVWEKDEMTYDCLTDWLIQSIKSLISHGACLGISLKTLRTETCPLLTLLRLLHVYLNIAFKITTIFYHYFLDFSFFKL